MLNRVTRRVFFLENVAQNEAQPILFVKIQNCYRGEKMLNDLGCLCNFFQKIAQSSEIPPNLVALMLKFSLFCT
jgi:hypothetical protein